MSKREGPGRHPANLPEKAHVDAMLDHVVGNIVRCLKREMRSRVRQAQWKRRHLPDISVIISGYRSSRTLQDQFYDFTLLKTNTMRNNEHPLTWFKRKGTGVNPPCLIVFIDFIPYGSAVGNT